MLIVSCIALLLANSSVQDVTARACQTGRAVRAAMTGIHTWFAEVTKRGTGRDECVFGAFAHAALVVEFEARGATAAVLDVQAAKAVG